MRLLRALRTRQPTAPPARPAAATQTPRVLRSTLAILEQLSPNMDLDTAMSVLRQVGLTEFALLTNLHPAERPANLQGFVPFRTDDDTQQLFTGAADLELLKQSIDFVRHFYGQVVRNCSSADGRPPSQLRVLDYGCGWGRLLRLMPYGFAHDQLLGVDPWQRAIDECNQANVLSPTRLVERDAADLADEKFDAGYAFSVFTHLPEDLARSVLRNLGRCFPSGGVLMITVRPPEWWELRVHTGRQDLRGEDYENALLTHGEKGYAYLPHPGETGDYYGDSSIAPEWLNANAPEWRIVEQERSLSDPSQIYWTLVRL